MPLFPWDAVLSAPDAGHVGSETALLSSQEIVHYVLRRHELREWEWPMLTPTQAGNRVLLSRALQSLHAHTLAGATV